MWNYYLETRIRAASASPSLTVGAPEPFVRNSPWDPLAGLHLDPVVVAEDETLERCDPWSPGFWTNPLPPLRRQSHDEPLLRWVEVQNIRDAIRLIAEARSHANSVQMR